MFRLLIILGENQLIFGSLFEDGKNVKVYNESLKKDAAIINTFVDIYLGDGL